MMISAWSKRKKTLTTWLQVPRIEFGQTIEYRDNMYEITNKKKEAEAVMICIDTSSWMEDIKSSMFQEQEEALRLYCTKKLKSHLDTVVGVCGMSDQNVYYMIFPTRSLEDIMASIYRVTLGGRLRLPKAVKFAYAYWFGSNHTDMQKRVVVFAGGPVCCPMYEVEELASVLRDRNIVCDVISFGDPYMQKRLLFDTLIKIININGNCNVCHVPPESSVPVALFRSEIISRRVRRRCSSPPPSPDKEEMAIQPIQICVKAPPTADANTD